MNARDTARDCITHDLAVIPIPHRKKHPMIEGWQNLRLTEADIPRYFANGSNIGLLNGTPSRGFVDVDR